jgi:hypothetical protein
LETSRPLIVSVVGPNCGSGASMFVVIGPDGVPDCAVKVWEKRRRHGALQVTPGQRLS